MVPHLGARHLPKLAVDVITPRVNKYIQRRQEAGATNSTIQKELAALKRAFKLAKEGDIYTKPPHIPSVKVDNARTGFVDRGDLNAILTHAIDYAQGPILFAYLTGWRKGEILPLTWERVNWDAGVVRLHTSKNGEGRTFPFHALPELEALLGSQWEARKVERPGRPDRISPWVFHREGKELKSIHRAFAGAVTRAGLVFGQRVEGGITFHDLRRSAVRNFDRAGLSQNEGMSLSGHKTASIYSRYNIVDSNRQAEAVSKLNAWHKSGTNAPRTVHVLSIAQEA